MTLSGLRLDFASEKWPDIFSTDIEWCRLTECKWTIPIFSIGACRVSARHNDSFTIYSCSALTFNGVGLPLGIVHSVPQCHFVSDHPFLIRTIQEDLCKKLVKSIRLQSHGFPLTEKE